MAFRSANKRLTLGTMAEASRSFDDDALVGLFEL
jgi:hypothetical protein